MNHFASLLYRLRRYRSFLLLMIVGSSFAASSQSVEGQVEQGVSKILFLGEIHDNAHGHKLRLERVLQLIEEGQQPVVAMEQFDRENQPMLDVALARCQDVDCVLDKAGTPGWEWRFYKPFVQWALEKKIKLVAANLSHVDVRKVMTQGFMAVLGPQMVDTYRLNQIPAQLLGAQNKAIQEGHCNMLPDPAIGPMVQGQIARDVWMAHVVNGASSRTVVLIAGNGHVRKDAGVYRWLTPNKQAITQVHGYVEIADTTEVNWYDQVHVVPVVDRQDPCLAFTRKPT